MQFYSPCRLRWSGVALTAMLWMGSAAPSDPTADVLPTPLELEQVVRFAIEHRDEIAAAVARADALAERPNIVGALEDPMIFSSIDHYPFNMMEDEENGRRYDWSISVEQRFPMSGVLGNRRRAAVAEAQLALANSERVRLDVILQAQESFFMLLERRRMVSVLEQQHELAEHLVSSASARYASGNGLQADVLRAEVEVARVEAEQGVLRAQTSSTEAMLNARMGRSPSAPIPEIRHQIRTDVPPPAIALAQTALNARPELRAGQSEIDRASAEIDVMRSMYRPMAMVRAGRATTMAEGPGAMVMLGISVPIWRGRLAASVTEAEAMERMARADLASMRLMIEGDAAAARGEVIAALTRLDSLEHEIVPRAQMAVDASLSAYAAGQGSLVSVIEAARSVWDARSELVMAETAVAKAQSQLERTVGATKESP